MERNDLFSLWWNSLSDGDREKFAAEFPEGIKMTVHGQGGSKTILYGPTHPEILRG